MTKVKVFIDFEAIASPFAHEARLENNLPYAYSLGIYVGKKFKIRTFIYNFQRDSIHDIWSILRSSILKDIKLLLDNKAFKLNEESIKFVGWDPLLEKKVLGRLFPKILVENLNKGHDISLSRITPEIDGSNYFEYAKKIVTQTLNPDFILKRITNSDGAIAAYVGYLLYSQVHHKHGKYLASFDTRTLLKELRSYSKDDVLRMQFLHENIELFKNRKLAAEKLISAKVKVGISIYKTQTLIKKLKTYSQKQTVATLVNKLEKKVIKFENDKIELEDNFDNF